MAIFREEKDVLDFLAGEGKDVTFVNVLFPDILGELRGFSIPSEEVGDAFISGKGFDGSSIEGLSRIEESDLVAVPDPTTFRMFPSDCRNGTVKEAFMFCSILNSDGSNNEGDTRHVLKRNLAKAREIGYHAFNVGPELEFFLFKSPEPPEHDGKRIYSINGEPVWRPETLDKGDYFSMGINDPAAFLRKDIMINLKEMEIIAEYDHHEVGLSQHEIDLRYRNALEMADNLMIHRFLVKRIASKHGMYATFMPKPLDGENGSGMHTHQSLADKNGRNQFFDKNDKYKLSAIAKNYAEGLLRHINEITAVLNPRVNSFKRLIPGFEAPVYHSWGQRNRSALIRVPEYEPGNEKARRIELRSPDPSCNPYLAFSVMLAAGLKGIEGDYKLREPFEGNAYESEEEAQLGRLPGTPEEALENLANGALVKETVGEHVFEKFKENVQAEITAYRTAEGRKYDKKVSPWELMHLFPRL